MADSTEIPGSEDVVLGENGVFSKKEIWEHAGRIQNDLDEAKRVIGNMEALSRVHMDQMSAMRAERREFLEITTEIVHGVWECSDAQLLAEKLGIDPPLRNRYATFTVEIDILYEEYSNDDGDFEAILETVDLEFDRVFSHGCISVDQYRVTEIHVDDE